MVAGGALADSLHAWQVGIPSKPHNDIHQVWESMPPCKKSVHTASSFNAEGKEASSEDKGEESTAGEEGKPRKMGRTEDDSPCECTDPPKKKNIKKNKFMSSLGLGGLDRDHGAVMERLKKEQLAAERNNANVTLSGPYQKFHATIHGLEKEIAKTE